MRAQKLKFSREAREKEEEMGTYGDDVTVMSVMMLCDVTVMCQWTSHTSFSV